jgi:uncharacterized protein (DUF885 family)
MSKFKTQLLAMASLLVGLFIWKAVVQPKDTRLRLYEILSESSSRTYGNSGQTKLISSWLSDLNNMNPNHLRPCEKIQYHNTKVKFERSVEQESISQTSLEIVSRQYHPDLITLEDLSQIGETEFEKVLSELQLFKTRYQNAGGIYSLGELAQRPENFRSNPNDVEDIYNAQIERGEESLASRFYIYDIPKGTANVVTKAHRYSAPASYNARTDSLIAYFDQPSYDVSIAAFISIHEIFPGHHLNWKSRSSGFICPGAGSRNSGWLLEGWATYAEFIADSEGFFSKPEQRLAWLDYRLVRAMRIILDVKRMQSQTKYRDLKETWDQRMPERLRHRFDTEIDRLVKSNHQHVSYILGYQAIMRTKTQLIEELGEDFNEKAFHDAILRLDHRYPKVLYETTKIAMELSDLPNGRETALSP